MSTPRNRILAVFLAFCFIADPVLSAAPRANAISPVMAGFPLEAVTPPPPAAFRNAYRNIASAVSWMAARWQMSVPQAAPETRRSLIEPRPGWVDELPNDPKLILDVGSAQGLTTIRLAKQNPHARIYAIDKNYKFTLSAISLIKSRQADNAKAVLGKLQNLQSDARFQKADLIYVLFPFAWFPWSLQRLARALHHVLKADTGRLILVTENPWLYGMLKKAGLELFRERLPLKEGDQRLPLIAHSEFYRQLTGSRATSSMYLYIIHARKQILPFAPLRRLQEDA